MKYSEPVIIILYLIIVLVSGHVILRKARNRTENLMGAAALVLGCGDAFHLVPRLLNNLLDADFTAALGIGKFITSVTMTVFYVLLYYVWLGVYKEAGNPGAEPQVPVSVWAGEPQASVSVWAGERHVAVVVWATAAVRIALCLFPQNGWSENSSDLTWAIIRNVPFVILRAVICLLYYSKRDADPIVRWMWLLLLLSFVFYIPVALGAGAYPILGVLMLPKTVCYVQMIRAFRKKSGVIMKYFGD